MTNHSTIDDQNPATPQNMGTTIDPADRDRFDALGDEWWDTHGSMKWLHRFTPVRIEFILDAVRRAELTGPDANLPLAGLRVLDIGCGGGLLCEPLARVGADIVGIDASSEAIEAAKAHSVLSNLSAEYKNQTAEDLAATGAQFDMVYASEVIEHVSDRTLFLSSMAQLLRPGGVFVLTTINRSLPALVLAKFAMEYVLQAIPKGAHDFQKFVRPSEMRAECKAAGMIVDRTSGFVPTITGKFITAPLTAIGYGVSGVRAK